MVASTYDSIYDVRCNYCKRVYVISCNRDDLYDWLSGYSHIQDILNYLTAGERELLLSGTCGECFDKMFPPLDNGE